MSGSLEYSAQPSSCALIGLGVAKMTRLWLFGQIVSVYVL